MPTKFSRHRDGNFSASWRKFFRIVMEIFPLRGASNLRFTMKFIFHRDGFLSTLFFVKITLNTTISTNTH